MTPLKIFIGFDPVEAVAYHTLVHSITEQASVPVAITPVNLRNLRSVYKRPRDPKQSNEFSFTRFLVPYLCDFEGWALFMDCDMMLRTDIAALFSLADESKALMCVKHDYTPKYRTKYLGNVQYTYPRKNWSSVVLWNCGHPANKILNPHYVNNAPALELHRFTHLQDEVIGELPLGWNWLVGDYVLDGYPKEEIYNVHWTNFGPWLDGYEDTDFADEWFYWKSLMTQAVQEKNIRQGA